MIWFFVCFCVWSLLNLKYISFKLSIVANGYIRDFHRGYFERIRATNKKKQKKWKKKYKNQEKLSIWVSLVIWDRIPWALCSVQRINIVKITYNLFYLLANSFRINKICLFWMYLNRWFSVYIPFKLLPLQLHDSIGFL